MKEIKGELWDYHEDFHSVICITTNGFVKKNGEAVMGKGCAAEAKTRYPELPKILGTHIRENGNIPLYLPVHLILTFPVKHNWWEEADLELIKDSVRSLFTI